MQSDAGATRKLLRSGVLFTAISFITGLGNLAFQAVMGRHLQGVGQFGDANSVIGSFLPMLGLLPQIATFAVTHYIAHYSASGDHDRLQGLLLGCRRFIFWITLGGSILVILVIRPLSQFFHYSESVMLITLLCTLLGLWASFTTMLCQGLGWFQRLAFIGLLGVVLRVGFGWLVTFKWPCAETAVLASGFALLANLLLLCWRRELALPGTPVSPWNRDFIWYLVISAAFVVGNFCFFQGDFLVAKKFFVNQVDLDNYTAAGNLARALPQTVAPLLAVMFTSRSGQRRGGIVSGQLKLVALSGFGLLVGAVCLIELRTFGLQILGRNTPAAAAMIAPFALTMVFVGLLQGLAFWSLASRWSKIILLYGVLGALFWLVLFAAGHGPAAMLRIMPVGTGLAFAGLFACWWLTLRRHHPATRPAGPIAPVPAGSGPD